MYKINEIFYSLQGEGYFTGTPAIFIRFSGCNLKCPFCDTKHNDGLFYTKDGILKKVKSLTSTLPPLVVLTGGEPSLFADAELCTELMRMFRHVAMESNGTHLIPEGVTFLTISPKGDFIDSPPIVHTCANEVKLVYTGYNNPEEWANKIQAGFYYLQPCDTGNETKNKVIIKKTLDYIKEHPIWRLSLQTQKILTIR